MIRLCKDCKHYIAGFDSMADICAHPDVQRAPDLVRGAARSTYCKLERDGGKCGAEGKLFDICTREE